MPTEETPLSPVSFTRSRSALLARLLEAERVREQTAAYLDRHGWDVVDDEAAWRRYQRQRMADEYRDDKW